MQMSSFVTGEPMWRKWKEGRREEELEIKGRGLTGLATQLIDLIGKSCVGT